MFCMDSKGRTKEEVRDKSQHSGRGGMLRWEFQVSAMGAESESLPALDTESWCRQVCVRVPSTLHVKTVGSDSPKMARRNFPQLSTSCSPGDFAVCGPMALTRFLLIRYSLRSWDMRGVLICGIIDTLLFLHHQWPRSSLGSRNLSPDFETHGFVLLMAPTVYCRGESL